MSPVGAALVRSELATPGSIQAELGLPIWRNGITESIKGGEVGLDEPQSCYSEAEIARQRAFLRSPIPGPAVVIPWKQRLMESEACSRAFWGLVPGLFVLPLEEGKL